MPQCPADSPTDLQARPEAKLYPRPTGHPRDPTSCLGTAQGPGPVTKQLLPEPAGGGVTGSGCGPAWRGHPLSTPMPGPGDSPFCPRCRTSRGGGGVQPKPAPARCVLSGLGPGMARPTQGSPAVSAGSSLLFRDSIQQGGQKEAYCCHGTPSISVLRQTRLGGLILGPNYSYGSVCGVSPANSGLFRKCGYSKLVSLPETAPNDYYSLNIYAL